jgi:hypothetical protein
MDEERIGQIVEDRMRAFHKDRMKALDVEVRAAVIFFWGAMLFSWMIHKLLR